MPFNLGAPELIIVLVIVLVVFGAGKLPNVMRDVGRGVKEFKKAQTEEEQEAERAAAMPMPTQAPPTTVSSHTSTNGTNGTAAPARASEPAPRA